MMVRLASRIGLLLVVLATGAPGATGTAENVSIQRVFALNGTETVFAYSRISADGELLTYTSQPEGTKDSSRWRIRLLRLSTGRELFSDTGFDGYFSPDGRRLIYRAVRPGRHTVVIRDIAAARSVEDVAPIALGDYYSWGTRDGRDVILTIRGHYFHLDEAGRGVMPASSMRPCPGLGAAERPLLSKDGRLATTFVDGVVVVRPIDRCDGVVRTGIRGAKADFSYDGRYIALHVPSGGGTRYDVVVVDLTNGDVRNVTAHLPGSAFYPSWTEDGRLSFRYDGADYQGFVMAAGILAVPPAIRRPPVTVERNDRIDWADVFGGTAPTEPLALVAVWGTWNVHGAEALAEMGRAYGDDALRATPVALRMATDPISSERLIGDAVRSCDCAVGQVPLRPGALSLTGMDNQNPAFLLFRDGRLVGRRLGVQSASEIREWVATAAASPRAR